MSTDVSLGMQRRAGPGFLLRCLAHQAAFSVACIEKPHAAATSPRASDLSPAQERDGGMMILFIPVVSESH